MFTGIVPVINTWTPVLTFATPGDLNVVYSSQLGTYTLLADRCHFSVLIVTSTFTHTTASGVLKVTGLPYTVGAISGYGAGGVSGYTKAGYTQIVPLGLAGQTYVQFLAFGSGVAADALNETNMPTGGTVIVAITGSYKIA